jgi:hypothetical protein
MHDAVGVAAERELGYSVHGERGSASLWGDLGAVPPVRSSGKATGGVRGLCSLKLTTF